MQAFAIFGLLTVTAGAEGLEKGVIYVQPSYHYSNTLSLDLDVLKRDLEVIAAGEFKNIGLRVSFGELITHWDPATSTPTYNESKCTILGDIAAAATARGIRLIFNTHLLDTVPQGIDGAYFVAGGTPDIYNVSGGNGKGVWRSKYKDVMVRETYRKALQLFHTKFASCFKDTPQAPRFWKHAFESCYIFPQNVPSGPAGAATVSVAIAKFGQWAQDTNPSIKHWADRWNEPTLSSFGSITLPNATSPKTKNGDFWRFWLIGVLKDGKYGLSVGDIHAALTVGAGSAYAPLLAFKHWKPANFLSTSDLTHEELVSAYDLPINATALGYYVNDAPSLAKEPAAFEDYITGVKAVAPPSLPIIVWETGGSTYKLTLAEQAAWAKMMVDTITKHGLFGFNYWQFIDWAPYPMSPCQGQTNCELFHFGAHFLNGTAKPVWDVLLGNNTL